MTDPLRVLVTGGNGQLGRDVRDVLAGKTPVGGVTDAEAATGVLPPVRAGAYDVLSTDIDTLDLCDRDAVRSAVTAFRPELVLHGGAFTAVDACESDPDTAFAVNALGTRHIAEASAAVGSHLVYVSTDYVFDGTSDRPYVEWDQPGPRSVYGRSKLGGETEVRGLSGSAGTVVRTAWVSGAHGANMVKTVLRLADATPGGTLRFVDDQHGSPTFTADLARALVRLGLDRRPGTFHVTNQGETTWFGFARGSARGRRPRSLGGRAHRDHRPRSAPTRAAAGQLAARQRRTPSLRAPAAPTVAGVAGQAGRRPRRRGSTGLRPAGGTTRPDDGK